MASPEPTSSPSVIGGPWWCLFWVFYYFSVSLLACAVWHKDRDAARRGTRRITEKTLWSLVMLGGSFGALKFVFAKADPERHKAEWKWSVVGVMCVQVLHLLDFFAFFGVMKIPDFSPSIASAQGLEETPTATGSSFPAEWLLPGRGRVVGAYYTLFLPFLWYYKVPLILEEFEFSKKKAEMKQ